MGAGVDNYDALVQMADGSTGVVQSYYNYAQTALVIGFSSLTLQ
jgi:hypothetical protein